MEFTVKDSSPFRQEIESMDAQTTGEDLPMDGSIAQSEDTAINSSGGSDGQNLDIIYSFSSASLINLMFTPKLQRLLNDGKWHINSRGYEEFTRKINNFAGQEEREIANQIIPRLHVHDDRPKDAIHVGSSRQSYVSITTPQKMFIGK